MLQEVMWLAQGHAARRWEGWYSHPHHLVLEAVGLTTGLHCLCTLSKARTLALGYDTQV